MLCMNKDYYYYYPAASDMRVHDVDCARNCVLLDLVGHGAILIYFYNYLRFRTGLLIIYNYYSNII